MIRYTNPEKLTARLIEVVNETMQPKSASVWLDVPHLVVQQHEIA